MKRCMKRCIHCKRKVHIDTENDLIHGFLVDKGVDPRMCDPGNPDSKIAQYKE